MQIDDWYVKNLVCPRTGSALKIIDNRLVSESGEKYSIIDGIPIMLLPDEDQTHYAVKSTIGRAEGIVIDARAPQFYLESLGISEEEKQGIIKQIKCGKSEIDPVVSYIIGATDGKMYKHLIGKLKVYPIPELRMSDNLSGNFLEIGCNWGRWCIAAARKGFNTVGIDPSLGAIMAARRVTKQLNLPIKYLVADGRFLPFRENNFDMVFSYSVLQHISNENVRLVLQQIRKVDGAHLKYPPCAQIK